MRSLRTLARQEQSLAVQARRVERHEHLPGGERGWDSPSASPKQ